MCSYLPGICVTNLANQSRALNTFLDFLSLDVAFNNVGLGPTCCIKTQVVTGKVDFLPEIRAVKNLCRTTLDTPKNMALLKLIKATREKIIVFVKYRGTVEHLTEL